MVRREGVLIFKVSMVQTIFGFTTAPTLVSAPSFLSLPITAIVSGARLEHIVFTLNYCVHLHRYSIIL